VVTLLTYLVHLFSVHTRTLVEYLHIHYTWNMHLNDGFYIGPKRRIPDVLFWGSVPWPALDSSKAYALILNIVDRSSLAAWWIFWLDMVWLISPQKPGYDTLHVIASNYFYGFDPLKACISIILPTSTTYDLYQAWCE